LESLAVGAVLLLPLLYVQGLPHMETAMLSLPLSSVAPLPPAKHARAVHSDNNLAPDGHVVTPLEIPEHPAQIHDESAPAPADISQLAVLGGRGDPTGRNLFVGSSATGLLNIAPPPPPMVRKPLLRISHLMDGYLIYRVQPEYPPLARQARVQGSVVLHALISRHGRIEKLQVVSGHPMLVQSAINAVSHWRYRPYVLNNEPVEVETQITVNFTLTGG
jgi:protein TonB